MNQPIQINPRHILVMGLLFGVFMVGHKLLSESNSSYFLSINLTATADTQPQLFLDKGHGYNPTDSCLALSPVLPGTKLVVFPVPCGTFYHLRFDPFDESGKALIGAAKIYDRAGHVLHQFRATDISPINDIQQITTVSDDSVEIITKPDAQDPNVELCLPSPITLPQDKSYTALLQNILPLLMIILTPWAIMRLLQGLQAKSPARDTQQNRPSNSYFRLSWPAVKYGTLACMALLLFLRMPDRFLNPQFYAEDAKWYTDFHTMGWHSLVSAYGGYLLTIDRIAACLATMVPLSYAPAVTNGLALVITLLVGSRILSSRNPLPYKPLLAIAIVLVPLPDDIFMTITNIQWVTALALVLLTFSDDASTNLERWSDYLSALIFGVTGVYSILLLPLYCVRAYQRRTSHSLYLAIIIGIAALVQAWFVMHAKPLGSDVPVPFSVRTSSAILGLRLIGILFGQAWLTMLSVKSLALLGIVAAGLLGYLGLKPASWKKPPQSEVYLCIAAFIFCAASIYRFKSMLPMFLIPKELSRYFFPPQIILIWLLVVSLKTNKLQQYLSLALLIAILTSVSVSFSSKPLADYHWIAHVEEIVPGQPVSIPTNPPGWRFQY